MLHIDDVIETTGDPEYLKRAFINVIDNAVKYSPDSGEVAVVLAREGDTAVVTVADWSVASTKILPVLADKSNDARIL